MTTVYLDPDQMDAIGGAVSSHATEVESVAAEVDALAPTSVPLSLAGWFADEVREIALTARLGAMLYLVATVDALQRSEQIRANQSLTAAVTVPANVTATFSSPMSGGFVLGEVQPTSNPFTGPYVGGGFVLGEVDTSGYAPIAVTIGSSQETFLANNPLLRIAAMQASTPTSTGPVLGVHNLINDSINSSIDRSINSRPGATSLGNGQFSGQGRIGDQIYRHPKSPGEFLVG